MRLAQAIETLELPDATMRDFLRLIEQMSGVPLTVRPDALAMARISLDSSVHMSLRNHSVGEALARGLQPFHLGFVVDGDQVSIAHRSVIEGRPAVLTLEVDDLLTESTPAAELLDWLQQCLPPGTVNRPLAIRIQDQRVIVRESPAIQFRVLRFLEHLRIARELPPRTVYGPAMRERASPSDRARSLLTRKIVPRWPRHATLSQLVDEWQDQLSSSILIDWASLSLQDITFRSVWQISTEPLELRQMLTALEKHGLTGVALHENLLWLTTVATEQSTYEVEFYACREWLPDTGLTPEQLTGQISIAMASSLGQDGLELAAESCFIFDPVSQSIIACLPPSQQLRLATGLMRLCQPAEQVAARPTRGL